ncbi:YdcF family protein [Sagittula stellata]|uniref:DUF218 domain-containing protein n=1 Tax=Sagittula stellata (strain ATCC 700073 / DSM 11524 / E-37) TaxID=388399 RepID=A3JY63_SAGS3|nr:YdcF family protein [Sagittula stellata]EBA10449.1 hypothetical protein SSE37_20627 [Sagittula stellata E-37]
MRIRVALVLGAKVLEGGAPSPALRRRAAHAAGLYRSGAVDALLATGGALWGGPSEAEVIARLCAEAGVPETALVLEEAARNTRENIALSLPLLARMEARRVVIVTDRAHAPRARLVARRHGLEAAVSCPVPAPWSLGRARGVMREKVAYGWYWLRG